MRMLSLEAACSIAGGSSLNEWYCYLSFNYGMIIPFEEVIKHEAMEGTLPAGRTTGILPEADAVSG